MPLTIKTHRDLYNLLANSTGQMKSIIAKINQIWLLSLDEALYFLSDGLYHSPIVNMAINDCNDNILYVEIFLLLLLQKNFIKTAMGTL